MANYKPPQIYNVPMKLLIPTNGSVKGVTKKTYPPAEDGILFYGSFRTFNGTENTVNGVYTLIDTAVIDSRWRPDITADCRIYLCQTGQIYEIISDPENINMRNQFVQFRVRKVGGVA